MEDGRRRGRGKGGSKTRRGISEVGRAIGMTSEG